MSEINAEFCNTCPSRGLCVGDVSLAIEPISYGKKPSQFPGLAIVGADSDGVTSTVRRITPEHYTYTGYTSRLPGSKQFATNPRDAVRSDKLYEALDENPDNLLSAIAERTTECPGPMLVPLESGMAITYENICRATAQPVLEALLSKEQQ